MQESCKCQSPCCQSQSQDLRNQVSFGLVKKIVSSLKVAVPVEDCADSNCAMEDVYLCASVISHLNSLYIDLTTETILSGVFKGLLDCGSTHCFADHSFIKQNKLHVYDITPVHLRLFDGSIKTILQKAFDIPIRFPSWRSLCLHSM
jgi:hypothetical protein